jgi:hypothetical protein
LIQIQSELDSILEAKCRQIEFEKKNYFEIKTNKARRCIAKPFKVLVKSKNARNIKKYFNFS